MMTSAYRDPSAHLTCGFHKHNQSNFFSSMNIGLIHTFYWRHQGLGREWICEYIMNICNIFFSVKMKCLSNINAILVKLLGCANVNV